MFCHWEIATICNIKIFYFIALIIVCHSWNKFSWPHSYHWVIISHICQMRKMSINNFPRILLIRCCTINNVAFPLINVKSFQPELYVKHTYISTAQHKTQLHSNDKVIVICAYFERTTFHECIIESSFIQLLLLCSRRYFMT